MTLQMTAGISSRKF